MLVARFSFRAVISDMYEEAMHGPLFTSDNADLENHDEC